MYMSDAVAVALTFVGSLIGLVLSFSGLSKTPGSHSKSARIKYSLMGYAANLPAWLLAMSANQSFIRASSGLYPGDHLGLNELAWPMILAVIALALLSLPIKLVANTVCKDDANWLQQHDPGPLMDVVNAAQIAQAAPGEPDFYGFRVVDQDASKELYGDSEGNAYHAGMKADLNAARQKGQLYGTPGIGLKNSGFATSNINSGSKGERVLAGIIAAFNEGGLNVDGFYSLYGLNERGQKTTADIDCVLLGIDHAGQLHAWFVDAKYYKGGKDTKYICMGDNTIARTSKAKHAFVTGPNGQVTLPTSQNMVHQAATWRPLLEQYHISAKWVICFVPGPEGTPDVSDVRWSAIRSVVTDPDSPNGTRAEYTGIPVMSMEDLIKEIHGMDLAYTANIPLAAIQLFKNQLKH